MKIKDQVVVNQVTVIESKKFLNARQKLETILLIRILVEIIVMNKALIEQTKNWKLIKIIMKINKIRKKKKRISKNRKSRRKENKRSY